MPICIECRYPISQLYHILHSRNPKSAAPTPSSASYKSSTASLVNQSTTQKSAPTSPRSPPPGGEAKRYAAGSSDVRLTQCPRCKRFADKYVEHDYVVLFIDLVLVKPQVYRHLLFNRFSHDTEALDPSIRRLGTLLLLFDVYLTMKYIESLPQPPVSSISTLNVFVQWGFFVLVCFTATLCQHLTIRWLASLLGLCGGERYQLESEETPPTTSGIATPNSAPPDPPKPPTPNSISSALFVSSFMSLFPILMIVWRPDEPTSPGPTSDTAAGMIFLSGMLSNPGRGVGWVRSGVSWAVAVQNLEALRILLGCGYLGAAGLVITGGAAKWVARTVILGAVGLNES